VSKCGIVCPRFFRISGAWPLPNKVVSGVCWRASNDWRASKLYRWSRYRMSQQINISGAYVLVTLAGGFSFIGLLVWTFVRYWLFAP
jgi:hypothetical protein